MPSWLWLHADPDHPQQGAFIYDFGLHPPFRGKGYAKEALARLEDKAKDLGVRKISLHVFAHNETARKLYEKTGFLETDVIMSKSCHEKRPARWASFVIHLTMSSFVPGNARIAAVPIGNISSNRAFTSSGSTMSRAARFSSK